MEEDDGVSLARLILLVVAGLLFLGVIIGGIYWLQSIRSGGGEGTLIAAPEGSYKIPAEDPYARTFQGEGDSSFTASEGMEGTGKIDPTKLPEAPVADRKSVVSGKRVSVRLDRGVGRIMKK